MSKKKATKKKATKKKATKKSTPDQLSDSFGAYATGNVPPADTNDKFLYPDNLLNCFTDRSRKVLRIARFEARALKHNYIGTEHLLLAMLKDVNSIASKVCEKHKITYETLQKDILVVLNDPV